MPLRIIFTAMLTIGQAFYHLKNELLALYDEREAAAIAHEVLTKVTGLNKLQRLAAKEVPLTQTQQNEYTAAKNDLLTGKPLQYIVGSAWFMGREFAVNNAVLIPRPETEELVQWILDDNSPANSSAKILDVGTGSGCIPISLKLALPDADVASCDISIDAIAVATRNAAALGAAIKIEQVDFLNVAQRNGLGTFDIIVSNPPYIPENEKEKIHTNVKDHEPAIALFVPDNDALIFYRAIALFGKEHLSANGSVYCELDAGHAHDTRQLFESEGYAAELRKDIHGNWRLLKASRG